MGADTEIRERVEAPIIYFDGICNLCNGAVQFVIKRDPNAKFRFASLQSLNAAEVLRLKGINPSKLESIILYEEGILYEKSTAVLKISRNLNGLWPIFYALIIVPRGLRDLVYDWIARNRYQWFGKRDECMVPTKELTSRFIQAG